MVLGSGMAGFGAARYLHDQGARAEVYDQNPYFGGQVVNDIFRDATGHVDPWAAIPRRRRMDWELYEHPEV